jgi:hypothetical protein
MSTLLIMLIVGFALAAGTALVRGLRAFLADSDLIRGNGHAPREAFGVQQNRMMTQRVLFQALAIVCVMLIGALAGRT